MLLTPLEACKKFLGEGETKLESDIASEMKSFNMKAAAITSGIGAMLMIGGGTLTIFWAIYKRNRWWPQFTYEA